MNLNESINQKNHNQQKDIDHTVCVQDAKQSDILDGSKNYHSFARDNGKFGSMPSFDAMDDESFS